MRRTVLGSLATCILWGCSDSSASPNATDAASSGNTFGTTVLLEGDAVPPPLPPDQKVFDLHSDARRMFCDWLGALTRPTPEECNGGVTNGDKRYIPNSAVVDFCWTIAPAAARNECDATLEEVAACGVATADCETRVDSPGSCEVLLREPCAFKIFPFDNSER